MVESLISKSDIKFSESNALSQLFQANALVFLLISVVIGLKQFYAPINCVYDGMLEQQKSFVDEYCWRNYEHFLSQPQRVAMPLPEARVNMPALTVPKSTKQSSSYRWLPLILLLQALLSYLPTWLWASTLRDGRLYETISSIKNPMKPHNRRKLLIINLANDLFSAGIQRRYAKPFFFCEILNVISFCLNVLLTNLLFHNQFFTFGLNEFGMRFHRTFHASSNPDPSFTSDLFPSFAKCSVKLAKKSSGSTIQIQKEEAICTISFNSLCESVFVFLWVWFCILIIASVCGITYRLFIMLCRRKRKKLLMQIVDKSFEEKLSQICEKLGFYSWFTLYRISRNVDPLTFQDIISSLMVRLDSSSVNFKTIAGSSKARTDEETPIQTERDILRGPVSATPSTMRKNGGLATIV